MTLKINGAIKWASLIILALGIFAKIITSHAKSKAHIEAVDVKVKTIKTEGCLPARATDISIAVIETEIKGIHKQYETMEESRVARDKAQTVRYDAIMAEVKK